MKKLFGPLYSIEYIALVRPKGVLEVDKEEKQHWFLAANLSYHQWRIEPRDGQIIQGRSTMREYNADFSLLHL